MIGRAFWAWVLAATAPTPHRRWAYHRYLESRTWRTSPARAAAKRRAAGRCEACGERRRALHAHHVTYRRVGRERADDFRILCDRCHRAEHGH